MNEDQRRNSKLGRILTCVFLIALVMGPGPGIYLVNPHPADPASAVSVLGVPILYLWSVFWLFVEIAVVTIAYFKIWNRRETE